MRVTILFAILGGCILSLNAFASDQTGGIQSIQALNDGRIIVFLQTTRSGKPACATYDYWFVTDENSNAGKTQLAILLSAQAAGRDVQIVGTGSCVRWVDGENIASVKVL